MGMNEVFAVVLFAASRRASGGDVPVGVLLLVVMVAVALFGVAYIIQSMENEKRRKRQEQIDRNNNVRYLQWQNTVEHAGHIAPVPCSLMLKRGEQCLYVAHNVTLFEVRAVRNSTHTFGSMPLGNSRIRIGRGYSTSSSSDEWKPIASGELYVTNKQVYFDGDKQDRKIPIGKVATIKADYSAVEISSETRQKSMVFMGCNGQIVRDIVQCVSQG